MMDKIITLLSKKLKIDKEEIKNLVEIPPSSDLGDLAFPCFTLTKKLKKSPQEIAEFLKTKIPTGNEIEKIETKGPYLNFFFNKTKLAEKILKEILKEKEKYGCSTQGKKKRIVIDMSSPNIAKPFGIGHLRSTIIGNSISNIAKAQGYETTKINYLGDWGTQFGKLIAGYKKYGSEAKLRKDPIKHLLEVYVKANRNETLDKEAREWFKKLEDGDKGAISLWKKFRKLSLKEFNKIYDLLDIKFDSLSGESFYNKKMVQTIKDLKSKNLTKKSQGALIIDLGKYNLGIVLIQKSDGATLYSTRDITAAIDRHKKYKFTKMMYEVGSEQSLHFKQIFKILELLGHKWSKECVHINHGFYLGEDGKKLATRKGKTIFMEDVLNETIDLAKNTLQNREKLSKPELNKRARQIATSAIIYGDLKNHRVKDSIFNIKKYLSFEGNTGPYLLYTYARARSILRKAKYNSSKIVITKGLREKEKSLILTMSKFPEIIEQSFNKLAPNLIANYAHSLGQEFNEFYHSAQVIGSENQEFLLSLVDAASQVLKNSLTLLGIKPLEKM